MVRDVLELAEAANVWRVLPAEVAGVLTVSRSRAATGPGPDATEACPDAAGPGSGQREQNRSGGVAPCIRIWNNQS